MLNASELGQAMAAQLNKELPADRFPRNAPGASTDNDWKRLNRHFVLKWGVIKQQLPNDNEGAIVRS
jgi:hypothetical protein